MWISRQLPKNCEAASRFLGYAAMDWIQVSEGWRSRARREGILCKRVLLTSRGWTANVEIVPAERPAMVSTSAGERSAWLSVIREDI